MAHINSLREPAGRPVRPALARLSRGWRSIIDRLPTSCGLCEERSNGGRLCVHCQEAVLAPGRDAAPRCSACSLRLDGFGDCADCLLREPAFDRVIAAFDYGAPGDLLIHHLKVGHRFIAAHMLASLLTDAIHASTPALSAHTILVPVPASRAAILRRGFNPAAEIARCLARQLQLDCRPALLLRAYEGIQQTHLNRVQRAQGAQGLYRCPRALAGLDIAVVDDVLTTGSTLHAVASACKDAGAATVTGLVLARTPYL